MSFGRMNAFIDIVEQKQVKDAEGFTCAVDTIVASVRAYREDRHGTAKWANRAVFSSASALFRFRVIPGITVTPGMAIVCADGRYRILSAEDVKGRGMYVEALAEKIEPSMR